MNNKWNKESCIVFLKISLKDKNKYKETFRTVREL